MAADTLTPLFIRMHERDNVAIVVNDGGLPAGTQFQNGLTLLEAVPQGHKVALIDIAKGDAITRYNVTIGYAQADIAAGSWIQEALVQLPIFPVREQSFLVFPAGG